MSELKPCPFCECTEIVAGKDYTRGNYRVDCLGCSAFITAPSLELAIQYWNTRPIEDELNARIAQLTAENKRLKAVLNEWDMAWLTDCIAPQANGNETFGLDEGLVLCARMMKPILEETWLLLGKAEVVR